MSSESPVILITGCSTGLGKCPAQNSLTRGLRVIATGHVTDIPQELNSFAGKASGALWERRANGSAEDGRERDSGSENWECWSVIVLYGVKKM
ncbi:hypothetical protein BDP27DRAFT_1414105 [Rhodocollybia butyracea]|uniref:Uncharacterized protein n=1 Tax=Rhodocollybia butyracea TaxID=206335 RepID=A0A9P5Q954_9AGAR|nr:hypothetical protein BDP27DRAFT_1414105 [Rhodocollybia butyracea]